MHGPSQSAWLLSPWGSRIAVVLLTIVAYFPALSGAFLGIDDQRFVTENRAVHELDFSQALRYFTDPTTQAAHSWQGTYRPLRTLDFAIDWAIAGESPFLYHLKNVLYHALASLLAFAVFLRLAGEESVRNRTAALLGALVFALHPVQVESVAWITSRGDVLLLVFFLLALLMHLRGSYWAASFALLGAVFAKESAVVFPGVVLAVELYRGGGIRWRPLAAYGTIAVVFGLGWIAIQPKVGHLDQWWGGSWPATVQMMLRGAVFYAKSILLPVRYVYDYHVPAVSTVDIGTILGILILALAGLGLWRGSPRTRLAVAWIAIGILPVSNLIYTLGIPTAERFLYLPLVGLAFALGHLLSRRWRPAAVVILCLLSLTFLRSAVWRTEESLFASARGGEASPRGYQYLARQALARAVASHRRIEAGGEDPSLAAAMRRDAEEVVRLADDLSRLFEEQLKVERAGAVVDLTIRKANALLLLERHEEAYFIAKMCASDYPGALVYYVAGQASRRLAEEQAAAAPGETDSEISIQRRLRAAWHYEEAGNLLTEAHLLGYGEEDLRYGISADYERSAELYLDVAENGRTPEERISNRELAARDFFRAASVLRDINATTGAAVLLDSIRNHNAAGETFEAAAELVGDSGAAEDRARLSTSAGDSFFQVGRVQEALGGAQVAIRSFLRSGENYERAVVAVRSVGLEAETAQLLKAAATSLLRAARLMEEREETSEALRFYQRSLELFPDRRTAEAIQRLER
jgi:tetratricopeptide (TPR) repeat protein